MANNLSKPMPVSASFKFDNGTGKRDADATTKIKGKGDLRAQKGNNSGR
jgi:hypothetical protein